jgi:cell filamentation protein
VSNRYTTGEEGEFQPGSDEQVLRNRLGIADPQDMDEAETALLHRLYQAVLEEECPDRRITVADLKHWHRLWLGNVYEWAGRERSVNLGKGGFHFAAAAQVSRLLDTFERDYLGRFTPCRLDESAAIAAIAETHVEFILIHPFREGNGRLSRLLADVMATQGGHEPLDYSSWDADKAAYIAAIHAGLAGDYAPMQRCVAQAWQDARER